MTINYTSITDFNEQLRIAVSKAEGLCKQPKDIGDHTVTYGYGYTLIRKNDQGIWKAYGNLVPDLAAIGIVLTTAQTDALDAIAESLNTGKGATTAHAQLITDFAISLGKPDLTTNDAQTLFNAEWVHQRDLMESKFKERLGAEDGVTVFNKLQGTREMVAVASLFYNSPALLGGGLARALRDGNRAEAWYEIRYKSNKLGWAQINGNATSSQQVDIDNSIDKGLAKRRFYEAELFGLYNTNDTTNDLPEATQIYKMFTAHRTDILTYEANYGNVNNQAGSRGDQIAAANTGYNLSGSAQAHTLKDELKPAADVLISQYVKPEYGFSDPFNPLNIQVTSDSHPVLAGENTADQTGSDSDLLIGRKDEKNWITGQEGKDLLIGGDKDDVLEGGKGDDILVGGKDFDTYIWSPGDGNDKIIEEKESDGKISGIIKINNCQGSELNAAGGFIKDGDNNIWKLTLPDGTVITLTRNSPWKLVTEDGGELLLGDGFQDGDFGIKLIDTPEESPNPTTDGITVHGDLKYQEFYDSEGRVYYKKDGYGNYITTQEPSPDKQNELFDSSGNDHLLGYGGKDLLKGGDGNDILDGGSGNDRLIDGAGDDVLIGGTDSDSLFSGQGNDRLFAGAKLNPEDVLTAGETGDGADVIYAGAGDDWVFAQGGNNVIDAGIGDDVVFGQGGDDFIYGRAGDYLLAEQINGDQRQRIAA